ncbi:type II toxin-antitoxin system death-on-curing family toxin [Pantoea cypripedii]|uniref:type II toxin-antitoxin system death-on-curing family toxin n=1 Tax=Pantoea cypripedii TaxID=55209 RepID=UPI002FC6FC77
MNHVSAEEVIALHDYILKRYAGVAGMQDPGRAEAIVTRVINREYYEGLEDVFEIAATYWIAIARGHIFADANKRTSLNVTMLFLKRNGIRVADRPELVELTVMAAIGEASTTFLASQLRSFFASH